MQLNSKKILDSCYIRNFKVVILSRYSSPTQQKKNASLGNLKFEKVKQLKKIIQARKIES